MAWGKLIHEKNQNSKISWHCPFNIFIFLKKAAWKHVQKLQIQSFKRFKKYSSHESWWPIHFKEPAPTFSALDV